MTLAASIPSPDLAGTYRLAFTADAVCTTFPPIAVTRTYSADIVRSPLSDTRYMGSLSGMFATRLSSHYDRFFVAVSGTFARFSFWSADEFYGIVEQVGSDAYVGIAGDADLVGEGFPIDVPFSGSFTYCEAAKAKTNFFECATTPTTCGSTKHRLTITRQ